MQKNLLEHCALTPGEISGHKGSSHLVQFPLPIFFEFMDSFQWFGTPITGNSGSGTVYTISFT